MKDLKKITSALKKIRLSEVERMSGRSKLIQFMEDNPISKKPAFWEHFYGLVRRPMWATATASVRIVLIYIVEEVLTILRATGTITIGRHVNGFFELAIVILFIYTLLEQKELVEQETKE